LTKNRTFQFDREVTKQRKTIMVHVKGFILIVLVALSSASSSK